jgi:1-acyl-sn-glycerol-3-phosphate acyltransferase
LNLRGAILILWTVIWATVGIVAMIVDFSGRLYAFLAAKGWAAQILWLAGVKVEVVGGEGIDWKKNHVIASNHNSQLDIPILFNKLPTHIRFLAKRSLFNIPIFGWSLWIARFVPVDRGSLRKARKSIDAAARKIRKGPSLVVFPEGTRSPDGTVKKFKSGAFVMAIKAGAQILPVAIRGTFQIVPKTTLKVTPGKAQLIIGTPISCEGRSIKDKEKLRIETQRIVEQMFETGKPA